MTPPFALETDFRFLSDLAPAGCLHAAVFRSTEPHARIVSLDVSQARALPGVAAVVTAADVPGKLRFGLRVQDQPILCEDRVRLVGDPIVAIAAEDGDTAIAACDLVRIGYETLPAVTSAQDALSPGAPALHPGGNLLHSTNYSRGDLDTAFSACAHVIADEYVTLHQAPGFIETESALAVPDGNGLTVFAPGHYAEAERHEIAGILSVSPDRIRIVASPAGGSFGGKDQLHAQPLAAILAMATGRPVRLRYSREDSFQYGVKRHPFRIRMRTGCDADGRLLAHEVEMLADTGAYAQHGPEVLDTAHENAQGPYAYEAVRIEGRLVYTNNGIAGAMRGFGALQVQSALEQQIERLAARTGLDPVAFRLRNLRTDDAPGQLGQLFVAPSHARAALRKMETPRRSRRDGRYMHGTGIALVEKGEGFARGGPNHSAVRLRIADDGLIVVGLGLSEIGQGLPETASLTAQRILGCGPADFRIVLADTRETPDSGPIAASRGAGLCWRTIQAAAPGFVDVIRTAASSITGEAASHLRLGPGGVWSDSGANAPLVTFKQLATAGIDITVSAPGIETATGSGAVHAMFTACAAMVSVRVDRLTGRVAVDAIHFAPVSGPVLSSDGLRAQMEGGAALAIGFTMLERLDSHGGYFSSLNLDGYLMPTIADMARVTVDPVIDIPDDDLGPRGVGEIGVNAAAPAILNAVFAATGFVSRKLPIDPAALIAHIETHA